MYHRCPKSNQWLKEGENFEYFMDPLMALREGYAIPLEFWLALLQQRLNKILEIYLNGGMIRAVCLLWPWQGVRYSSRLKVLLDECTRITQVISEREATKLKVPEQMSSYKIAIWISQAYALFISQIQQIQPPKGATVSLLGQSFEDWSCKATRTRFYPVISSLRQRLAKYPGIREIVIHGSMATLDYIPGCSDLDVILFIQDKMVLKPRYLQALRDRIIGLRSCLYAVDPLQHHGYGFLTEIEGSYYPQSYLPFAVYGEALRLISRDTLVLQERDCWMDVLSAMWDSIQYLRKIVSGEISPRTLYDWKVFLQIIQLMPVLYYQARYGEFIKKKDSFEKVRAEFTVEQWRPVEEATHLRSTWPYTPINLLGVEKVILQRHPLLYGLLHRFVKRQVFTTLYECIKEGIVERAARLGDRMWKLVRERSVLWRKLENT